MKYRSARVPECKPSGCTSVFSVTVRNLKAFAGERRSYEKTVKVAACCRDGILLKGLHSSHRLSIEPMIFYTTAALTTFGETVYNKPRDYFFKKEGLL